jgi:hypothetical protein
MEERGARAFGAKRSSAGVELASSPSPPLEERAGERRPFIRQAIALSCGLGALRRIAGLNSAALHPPFEIDGTLIISNRPHHVTR